MKQVLELRAEGEIAAEEAQQAPFVGWNLAGTRPPLVLIRTWSDELPRHQRLARALGPEQPLYSMGHPVGDDPADYPNDASQWTELCLARFHPLGLAGPVRIGGWSFGGVIALEVARRLAADGHEIALVTLLDTRIPRKKPTRETRRWAKLGKAIQDYSLLHTPEQRRAWRRELVRYRAGRTAEKLRALPRKLRGRDEVAASGEMHIRGRRRPVPRLQRAIRVCYLKYDPAPCDLPIVQLWTDSSRTKTGGDVSLGWSNLLQGDVQMLRTPGGHYQMFDEPHVATLASHLARALERCEPAGPAQSSADGS
jgi:thioesterase domain-containing protein